MSLTIRNSSNNYKQDKRLYSPIQIPAPIPGGIQGNRLFLTDVIDLPDHYISIATSPYRPITKLAERFIRARPRTVA